MEYITFMHTNTDSASSPDEWQRFFDIAGQSGLFRGGSAMGKRLTIGTKDVQDITTNIAGYMRFEADSFAALAELLRHHPTAIHGGTIEICELPKT